jgi:hypothetical protein
MRKDKFMETEVTLKKGFNFAFKDGENDILAHGSAYSGKEIVFLNDEEVSSSRNYKVCSRHFFEANGQRYECIFYVTNFIYSWIECQLYKDGNLIGREEIKFFDKDRKKLLGILVLCGFVFGLIGSYLAFKF